MSPFNKLNTARPMHRSTHTSAATCCCCIKRHASTHNIKHTHIDSAA